MALNPSTAAGQVLKFHTPALDPNTLLVLSVNGRDAISHPYGFELELVSDRKRIDVAEVMRHPAFLAIKQGIRTRDGKPGVQTRRFHGVLAWFEQADRSGNWTVFRALLVPRFWRLSLAVRCRIFLEPKQTVPKIVEKVLKEHGFREEDFEFRLSRAYEEREYVVQYNESDLDFVQRLLEKEGIFYFFNEGDDAERLIFGDSPAAHAQVLGQASVKYQPVIAHRGAMPVGGPEAWFAEEVVRSFALRRRQVPRKVVVEDYNYRTPQFLQIEGEADASSDGYGRVQIYGDHFKTKKEGQLVAKIRAQEIACGEQTYTGVGDVRSFRAGATFSISEHYTHHKDYEREYVLTEVRHKGEQMIPLGGAGKFAASYENQFSAIPREVPFRPARRTPVPRANNINAKIDGATGEKDLDAEGRYRVQLPFDPGTGGGKSSRLVRMMQPYAGGGMGMCFPLHKGTEVVLTHINGDWDRPIIAGAVPDAERKSVVGSANQSQCVIATGGGNTIVADDTPGGERVTFYSPVGNTIIGCGTPP